MIGLAHDARRTHHPAGIFRHDRLRSAKFALGERDDRRAGLGDRSMRDYLARLARSDAGLALAHHLGRALQLTNILRDLDEDASLGRLYLPRDALQAAGIASSEPCEVVAHAAIAQACAPIVALAESEFRAAQAIMAKNPRRVVRAPRIMGEAYRLILDSLVARGWSHPRRPIRLPRSRLLWIIMRHAVI